MQSGRSAKRSGWSLDHLGRGTPEVSERSDAARNRRVILETARVLFEEQGVTCVTMEEVAREAGVGKGTLYRRFPNKEVLCRALLDEPTREFQAQTLALLRDREARSLDRLDHFLDRLVVFTDENLDLLYGGHDALLGAERLALLSHPSYDWRRSAVLGLLRAALREGELASTVDVEYLAGALISPLHVDLYYHQRRVEGLSVERISAGLRSLVPSTGRND